MTAPVLMQHPDNAADDPIKVSTGLVNTMQARGWRIVDDPQPSNNQPDLTEETENG